MPEVSKTTLKSYFQTGDRPSESNFVDLVDTLATLSGSETLANKTLTSPIINTPVFATPVPLASGGTGQTTANAAFTALAAAGGTMAGTFAGTPTFSGATVFSGGPNITTTALNLTVGQIAFPATQNASAGANTLDDYEEGLTNGSWTPSFTFGGAAVGQTYTRQRGFYIKIGRLVVAQFYVSFSNKGSSTGNASLAGLPFTQQSQTDYWGIGASSFHSGFDVAVTSLHLIGNTNTTTAEIYRQNGGASARMTDAGFTNTSEIIGQIIYLASA